MKSAITLLAALLATGGLYADTHAWTGSADNGDWTDPGNWAEGSVPEAGDDVTSTVAMFVNSSAAEIVPTLSSFSITASVTYAVTNGLTLTFNCPCSFRNGSNFQFGGSKYYGKTIFTQPVNMCLHTAERQVQSYSSFEFRENATWTFRGNYVMRAVGTELELGSLMQLPAVGAHYSIQFAASCTGKSQSAPVLRFNRANAFDYDGVPVIFGYASGVNDMDGILDLNGFDQTIFEIAAKPTDSEIIAGKKSLRSASPAVLTVKGGSNVTAYNQNGVTFDAWDGTLDGSLTLKFQGGSDRIFNYDAVPNGWATNTTDGALIAAGGTLKLRGNVLFPNLSEIRVQDTGSLEISSTAEINDEVDLYLSGSGTLKLGADLVVSRAYVSGEQLAAGVYEGAYLDGESEGRVIVTQGPVVEVKTHVWSGLNASDPADLTAADNWGDGGLPDLSNGSAILVFPNGFAGARVDGPIKICGLHVPGGFALAGQPSAAITIGTNGLEVTGSGVFTNTIPLTVESAEDVEIKVASAAGLRLASPLVSPPGNAKLLVSGGGSLELADSHALGTGETEIDGVIPTFDGIDDFYATLRIFNVYRATGNYIHLYAPDREGVFTHHGKITIQGDGSNTCYFELWFDRDVRFSEGIAADYAQRLVFINQDTSKTRVTRHVYVDKALDLGKTSEGAKASSVLDFRVYSTYYTMTFHLGARPSRQGTTVIAKSRLVCEAENVLPSKMSLFAQSLGVTATYPAWSIVDLNGYDQSVAGFTSPNGGLFAKYDFENYLEITSASEATLHFDGSGASTIGQYKFTGAVNMTVDGNFDMDQSITFTNIVNTTTGSLSVSRGTVTLANGAAWAGGTDITVSGTAADSHGTLVIGEGSSGAFARKPNGKRAEAYLKLNGTGCLELTEENETVEVFACAIDGTPLPNATYSVGATELDGKVTGAGSIKVLTCDGVRPGLGFFVF